MITGFCLHLATGGTTIVLQFVTTLVAFFVLRLSKPPFYCRSDHPGMVGNIPTIGLINHLNIYMTFLAGAGPVLFAKPPWAAI